MTCSAILVTVLLIVLHRSDGGEVTINAEQVTSLRSTLGVTHLTSEGHCVIGLTDGKFVTVLEPCREVKRQLEEGRR